MSWKSKVKKIPFIEFANAQIKCQKLKVGLARISDEYRSMADDMAFSYSEGEAIFRFRRRLKQYQPNFQPKRADSLKVFWVGSNLNQDESGFLQVLRDIFKVEVFVNEVGGYGSWDGSYHPSRPISFTAIRESNDRALLKQVKQLISQGGVDVIFGQMWAQRFSKEALEWVQRMQIPIINISMDDRLPVNWSRKNGIRLGSVGLATGLDMVLTTSSETCLWYGVEGCPSLFWPLAGTPEVFESEESVERDIDVLFIGNKYGVREKIIKYIQRNGIQVHCYGAGWPNGAVSAKEIVSLSNRAKIILGVGTVGHCADVYTLKLRDFEAPMSRALYLTHRSPDLDQFYIEGEEIECYTTASEAVRKLSFFLENPSQLERIAINGHSRAVREHSWRHRILNTFTDLGLIEKSAPKT
jgi:hypothetical protein